jgi:hypothetical protein
MREININDDDGGILAFILDHKEDYYKDFIKNNMTNEVEAALVIKFLEINKQDLLVVRNLHVERSKRGKGMGTFYLKGAMHSAKVPLTLLISDKTEKQKKGFNLDVFYEANGFEKVVNTVIGGLMIYPKEKAREMKDFIDAEKKMSLIIKENNISKKIKIKPH